jgi:hypothetical protein
MVSPGAGEHVVYAAGVSPQTIVADLSSKDRIMSIDTYKFANNADACAREISNLEAIKPPIILMAPSRLSEALKKLRSALLRDGFADVSTRMVEPS